MLRQFDHTAIRSITAAFVSATLAASISTAQTNPPGKPSSVEGVVINSVTSEPVKKAIVILQTARQGPSFQAVSDNAGHFRFDSVDPGSYFLVANRDGFMARSNRRPQSVTVAEEQDVQGLTIALLPLAQVSGHVLNADGAPIMSANVQALRYGFNQGRKELIPAGFATTNDLGEFEFLNLEAGKYFFRAAARTEIPNLPPRTRFSRPRQAYPPIFYPNASDPKQATATSVAAGAEVSNIDFRLEKVPAFHIRGKVLEEGAQPVDHATVGVQTDDTTYFSIQYSSATTQADGSFDLPAVVPGTYVISAGGLQRSKGFAHDIITVSDHDVNGITLAASSGLSIAGRFQFQGSLPNHINGQVILQTENALGQAFPATVNPDGAFVIQNAVPGPYRINVSANIPGVYVQSIYFGDSDVSSGLLDLPPANANALTVVFGSDGGEIHGTVQTASGEPVVNALVTLAPAEDRPGRFDLFKQTNTDQKGNFQFEGIAPGDYKAFAWENVDANVVRNFDFQQALSGHAASVTIAPNASETLQLQLISADDAEAEKNKLL